MKLVIVESPTKAKTLTKHLGKEFKVTATYGHIRDLPTKDLGVDVENDFTPIYEIPTKAKKTITALKKESKGADSIILATDPDREGEAIAWHVAQILDSGKKSKKATEYARVVFHEITKEALEEAFKNPGKLNIDLVDAQQARRILDRLVGYNLSPLLWKKVRYGLSAGRVQSVAVRLIVERERERTSFKPEEYWDISGNFKTNKSSEFKAQLTKKNGKKIKLSNEKDTRKLESELNDDHFKISDMTKSERKRSSPPPFKTSTLQQTASNFFGFTAKRTMSAAQKLFESGYITYHRTDSLSLSPQFANSAREFIKKSLGDKYVPTKPKIYKTTSKGAQEAHEAIRPSNIATSIEELESQNLTGDEIKLYSLILKRSLECQASDASYNQTTIKIDSDKGYEFVATGSIIGFDGWLAVGKLLNIGSDKEDFVILPDVNKGDDAMLTKLESSQHFTQPPARYSDATLIKALEELGIGRPSTYAPTISTIQQRKYVGKEGRYFYPEDVAYVVNDLLVEYFKEVIDYGFTAEMEEKLDLVADGKLKWVPVLKEFYAPFKEGLKIADDKLEKKDVTNLGQSDEKCPKCQGILNIKLGKYGKFLSCSNFPDCDFAKPLDGEGVDKNGDAKSFGKCDKCEEGQLVLKQGRFGKFLACNKYPECKNTKPFLEKIDMKCPKCAEEGRENGDVVVKKAKGRIFYGCSNYPTCKYASWKNPLEKGDTDSENSDVEE